MKLKIKETGELLEDVKFIDTTLHKLTIQYLDNGILRECVVKNLSDVEEVKDYEEPEGWWFIDRAYEPHVTNSTLRNMEADRQIGNYFETREEAEKAVEKLKAWKRLKDKGFRFKTWYGGSKNIDWEITSLENETYIPRQICDDLDLLFGGEYE